MRRAIPLLTALALIVACSDTNDEPPVEAVDEETGQEFRDYPDFSDVDPYTSGYFIALEGTGLAASQGEERLYNLGVNICQRLDADQTVEEQFTDQAPPNLGDEWGAVIGAAVSDLCPQHSDALETFMAANQ